MININLPSGHKLLEQCRPMYEYSWFIQQFKDYLRAGLTRDAAITQAVNDCIEEGILVEFMKNHGSEVANMLYTQWKFDEAVLVEREEAYEDGREAGKAIGMAIGKAEGIAEGRAEGIAEGRAEGIAEGRAEGIAEGRAEGIAFNMRQIIYDFLEQLGEIPENIRNGIAGEQDEAILRKWCMTAPGVKSFEEFRESMETLDKPCHQASDL